ncbi:MULTISPECIES: TonB-dependent receptor plug domain-containing protein [Aquimarina]|uniref:TonB-dependent receptor plug domain-containing protein n=1 Tax=Aquimarina TaxID=290174 RepID=UPI000D694AAE|nr:MULTISPECIES: TonB-dependent receptor plug domain-containing protein [Aquimarina]
MKVHYYKFLMFFFFVCSLSFAQEKNVSGTVTDDQGLPLPGVNVIVKNTSGGTQTDFDGNYSISVNRGAVISFSYVGFETKEVVVGDSDTINMKLSASASELEEVIITGQGSGIAKRKLSTTVDVLKADEIDKLPSNQIDQLLQSTTPSAQIRLSSGQPGTAAIIRTRGAISASTSATPIVIVDGVRVDNLNSNAQLGIVTGGASVSALADIPTESIERIEYIKGGAATTLYGADAANGVIQVITKKGTKGKSKIFYEARVGVIKATEDFLKYDRTAEAFFEPGLSLEHRVGINGGGDKVTYNFGGSIYADDSFNDINKQVRRSLSFGLNANVTDKLRYQASFSYVGTETNLDFNANSGNARFSDFEGGDLGDLDVISDTDFAPIRENYALRGALTSNESTINRFTNSNKFIYDVNDNLQVNATLGIDYRTVVQNQAVSNALQISRGAFPDGTSDRGALTRATRNNFIVTGDLNVTHKAALDNFSFVTILGGQFFRNTDRQNRIEGSGGVDGTSRIGFFPTQVARDFVLENANYGLYFLENIGIYDVAFLEFGGRLDENTSAGANTDPLFLPKVGITYNISDHDFYSESGMSNILSSIKLRANYGEATNFAQPFSEVKTFVPDVFLGGLAVRFDQPGNTDLVSERVKTTEFGLDLGFLNNRINFSSTRYDGKTEDALFVPNALPSSGLRAQVTNLGEISNSGWEFALNADVIKTSDHLLSVNFSYNTNDNSVEDSGGSPAFVVGGFNVIGSVIEQGQSLGYLRGTSATRAADGTFTFTPNDALGDTFAPNFGSFGINYQYKNFNLFMTGDYQFGGSYVDLNFLLRHLNGVDNTGIPDDLVGTTSPFNYVNFFVFDNDFVKIRNIGATYSFGDKLKPFSNVILGFTATNPFNWTSGPADPEITGSGIAAQNGFSSGGFAYGTESAPRIFLTSLKFQF